MMPKIFADHGENRRKAVGRRRSFAASTGILGQQKDGDQAPDGSSKEQGESDAQRRMHRQMRELMATRHELQRLEDMQEQFRSLIIRTLEEDKEAIVIPGHESKTIHEVRTMSALKYLLTDYQNLKSRCKIMEAENGNVTKSLAELQISQAGPSVPMRHVSDSAQPDKELPQPPSRPNSVPAGHMKSVFMDSKSQGEGRRGPGFQTRKEYWKTEIASFKAEYEQEWQARMRQEQHKHATEISKIEAKLHQTEAHLNNVLKQMDVKENLFSRQMDQTSLSFDAMVKEMAEDFARQEQNILRDQEKRTIAMKKHIEQLEGNHQLKLNESSSKLQTLEERHRQNMATYAADREYQMECIKQEHNERLHTLHKRHQQEIDQLKKDYHMESENMKMTSHEESEKAKEAERKALVAIQDVQSLWEEKMASELASLMAKHTKEIDKIREDLTQKEIDMESIAAIHMEELARHQAEAAMLNESTIAEYEQKMSQVTGNIQEVENEKQAMVDEYKLKMDQLQISAARQLETERTELQKTISSLYQEIKTRDDAVFQRDHSGGVADHVLQEGFGAIVSLVDDICSRDDWLTEQPVWSESVTSTFTRSHGRLCSQILQDHIWWLLHDAVFCSPFRMFGARGLRLEEDWQATFGNDGSHHTGLFTWPTPATATEMWRYETLRACTSALQTALSPTDPRVTLKKDFKHARDALILGLTTTSREMLPSTPETDKMLDVLAKKVTAWWAVAQAQRYRLMVEMPSGAGGEEVLERMGEEEKLEKAREGGLLVMGAPAVVRYGDSRGLDLESREFLGRFEGDVVKVL